MMETPKTWKVKGSTLFKQITLNNFLEIISLVNKIAETAEKLGHHPDLEIYNYKNLKIKITTHDSKALTKKDYELAEALNKIL